MVDIYGPPVGVNEHYRHDQGVPDSMWTITHNLGFFPNVTVLDSAGTQIEGDRDDVSADEVILTFVGAFAGTAYLS